MKKELCVLLTTTMLTTCLGTAVAAPIEDTAAPTQPAITAPADVKDDVKDQEKKPAAELTEAAPVKEAAPITVKVDGKALKLDQPPVIQDGRTLVPLRAIFEALGAQVQWDAEAQSVIAEKRLDIISLVIGDNKLNINGDEKTLDVPAQIIEGRTMVPVRAISEAFGAKVDWNAATGTVTVDSVQTGAHAITDKYLNASGKTADGSKTLYTVSAAYPVLANPDGSTIVAAINTEMKKAAEDYIAYAEKTVADMDIDPNVVPTPYEFTLRYEVTYDQDGLLSFCTKAMEYTGGAHPNTIMTCKTLDTTLGKELALTDVLKGTKEEVNKQIIDGFTALIDKNAELYLSDAKDNLAKEVDNAGFYLTKDGVVVSLQLYTLPASAAGFSTCTLPPSAAK